MEKINIAQLLKDCPKGMELYSPIFGKVYLDKIRPHLAIVVTTDKEQGDFKEEFLYDGRYGMNGECMLFPSKGKTTWEGFVPPRREFKKESEDERMWKLIKKYVHYNISDMALNADHITREQLKSWLEKQGEKSQGKSALEAINEEKVDNQNCVKSTDKVEPKFKVGDKIQHKNGYSLDVSILKINADCYTVKDFIGDQITIDFTHQDNYELVPDKFDIDTLVPFDSRVLVRNGKDQYWIPAFWGYRAKDGYVTTFGHSFYCIPYEGNEHLFKTKDDCSDFYKTWE